MAKNRCPNGGKISYHSEEEAKEARKSLKYKHDNYDMSNAKVYKCPKCWRWHITTKGY